MNELFNLCVEFLHILKVPFGMTYQEINIWLFVVIHPLLTTVFFVLWIQAKAKNKAYLKIEKILASKMGPYNQNIYSHD